MPKLLILYGATSPIKNAPKPNPVTAIPVIKPRLSGNQRIKVAIGVTYPKPLPNPAITP